MKPIPLAIVALATSAAAAPPHPATAPGASAVAKPLPVFSFMGNTTDFTFAMPKKGCYAKGNTVDCTEYGDVTLAGAKVDFLSQAFNNGKLYRVTSQFDQGSFPTILAAFSAKYGSPQSVEKRKWQSKGGASFDNTVAIWNFKGGDLELSSMGGDVDHSGFVFLSDENAPEADKPKVDF